MMAEPQIFESAREAPEPQLSDYLAALRRRRGLLVAVFVLVLATGLAVTMMLPAQFRSSATVLIEQQEIPADLVRSTVTTYADQRIQLISARVMTSANLMEVVRKYDLYAEQRQSVPAERLVENMRAAIELKTVSADVVDPRTGRPTQATIAFQLAFSSPSPATAQRVTNELASLFLNENLRSRRQMAVQTSSFLAEEVGRLEAEVSELEERLANFKSSHADRLPEMVQMNLQLLDRAERELLEVERQINAQQQNVIYLRGQLARLEPTLENRRTPVTLGGETVLPPAEQLALLETRLASRTAVYAPDHPDVLRLRREVEALRTVARSAADPRAAAAELAVARDSLAQARQRYGPEHPDVRRLERSVAGLEDLVGRASIAPAFDAQVNPAHVEISARLEAARNDLESLTGRRDELRARLVDYEMRVGAAPGVEREYRSVTRNLENSLAKYHEVRAKLMEAQMAETLESDQKAERFTLIEPALLPEAPSKPNRAALGALSLMLAFAAAIGVVALVEALDRSVRGTRGVVALFGTPPLGAIPPIESPRDRRGAWVRRVLMTLALVMGALGVALLVDQYVRPLDVLWYSVLNRLLGG